MNATAADLEKHRRLLARADKLAALGKVSAGVAHEIRNPLTAVKMLIYSLREETATNDETRSDLSVIMKELERIERFVQNFLEFARPPDPHIAPVDLNASIRETLALWRRAFGKPNRRDRNILPRSWPRSCRCRSAQAGFDESPAQCRRCHAERRAPKIVTQRTEAGLTKNGKTWVQIHISDTGKGIPAELLDNLFDPFITGSEEARDRSCYRASNYHAPRRLGRGKK
jgi:signal transduction histidine kinase